MCCPPPRLTYSTQPAPQKLPRCLCHDLLSLNITVFLSSTRYIGFTCFVCFPCSRFFHPASVPAAVLSWSILLRHVNTPQFIQSTGDGLRNCFQFLASIDNAVINIPFYVFCAHILLLGGFPSIVQMFWGHGHVQIDALTYIPKMLPKN